MDEPEIYMKGWKILKILHRFTQPQICPEGNQTEIEQKGFDSNRHDFDSGIRLVKAGEEDVMSVDGRPQ